MSKASPTARIIRDANLLLGIGWGAMIPVSLLTGLRNSVPYLVFLSVYSPCVGHISAWISGRAEVASEENP